MDFRNVTPDTINYVLFFDDCFGEVVVRILVYCARGRGFDPRTVQTIDLVLIDPQSVGKRTHDLMDTVHAKKRCKTIC
jgi:hypothetical protein